MLIIPNTFQILFDHPQVNHLRGDGLVSERKEYVSFLIYCGLFFLCLCTIAPRTTFAFYPEIEKDFFFVKERSHSIWSQGERRFVIYDNYSYSVESGKTLPLLVPLTNEFVPADIIIANIPLTDLFRENLGVEDYVSNLLYANLRLKKMLEEYAHVQKTAYELIHGIEQSGPSEYENAINFGIPQPGQVLPNLSSSESDKVYKQILKLKKWQVKTHKDKDTARRAYSVVIESNKQVTNYIGTTGTVLESYTYGQSYGQQATSYYSTNDSVSQKNKPSGSGGSYGYDAQLPWLISFPMKIIDYLLRNKIEAIFYFFITLIPVYLISSLKSR